MLLGALSLPVLLVVGMSVVWLVPRDRYSNCHPVDDAGELLVATTSTPSSTPVDPSFLHGPVMVWAFGSKP